MSNEAMIHEEEDLRKILTGETSSDTYRKNYLVEAGAGAGKTYTMVNRIVNQLIQGYAEPEELAAITFTEKATQEMQERIDSLLRSRLKESKPDSEEYTRIRALQDSVDRMQISTVHSFCSKMLQTMPFDSVLGPEFQLIDDDETYAGEYFDRLIADGCEPVRRLQEETGVGLDILKFNFLKLCEQTSDELYVPEMDAEEIAAAKHTAEGIAREIYVKIAAEASEVNIKNRDSKAVQAVLPQIKTVLKMKDGPCENFTEALIESSNPLTTIERINADAMARVLQGKIGANKSYMEDRIGRITEIYSEIIHAQCMKVLRQMILDYRTYKAERHMASQGDLLVCARDMLRDSSEARSYFHNRYKAIYVDEMQDTDPLQAQIFFYLTTDENDFHAENWMLCRPVPGSLFIVGDPKQAIYRFTGADITVYNKLKDVFVNGYVGEFVQLHLNFRSSTELVGYGNKEEVSGFTDKVFADRMTGGGYQAEYSPMNAFHGDSPLSRLIGYEAGSDTDAEHVAAFIAELHASKATVGLRNKENDLHEVKYSDFMILTSRNASTERYVRALSKYGIPCSMAGNRSFADVKPIRNACLVLKSILDRKDETKLAAVLTNCYGITLPSLRNYRVRAKYLTVDYRAVKKAYLEEGRVPEEFETVFSALAELDRLRAESFGMPAMTVAEDLFFKTAAVWSGVDRADRSSDYAMICQFMNQLRDKGFVSFVDLAEEAIALSEDTASRELLLEEKEDCVRIMNLHKAKGLEAEIVILAFDTKRKENAMSHVAEIGGKRVLHTCLKKPTGWSAQMLASEKDWETYKEEEESFLAAESVRLLYVAATRAKTCLIVNMTGKQGRKSESCWMSIGERIYAEPGEAFDPAAIRGEYTDEDPCWEKAVNALRSGVCDVSQKDNENESPAEVLTAEEMEGTLREASGSAAEKHAVYITPSRMENNQKGCLQRDTDGTEETPAAEIEPEAEPCGADWGTIMHRVMELTIRSGICEKEAVEKNARQAIYETLGDASTLTKRQKRLLLGSYMLSMGETLTDYLMREAVRKAAFITDPACELRVLTDGAACYTELPFILRETDPATELAHQVNAIAENPNGMPIDINGVIDLAVRRGDAWTVVDYKTDMIRRDETAEKYAARLIASYAPQLKAYRTVINRLGRGKAEQIYICALNLNGKLIKVD